MRIITGKYKGRVLKTLSDLQVRPATDRVKTTIFDMLQNRVGLNGAEVLDLFAGSGNLGFEALSRGAKQLIFVDDNEAVLDVIEQNAEKLNCLESCGIIRDDAIAYLENTKHRFDLIFADPPYAYARTPEIPQKVFEKGILRKGGYMIVEHSKRTAFPSSLLYALSVRKEFGNSHVSFFIHPPVSGVGK